MPQAKSPMLHSENRRVRRDYILLLEHIVEIQGIPEAVYHVETA